MLIAGLGSDKVLEIQGDGLMNLYKVVEKFIGAPEWFLWLAKFDERKKVLLVFVAPSTGSIYPSLASSRNQLESRRVYIRNQDQTKEIFGPQLRMKVHTIETGSSPDLKIQLTQLGTLTERRPPYSSA